MNARPLMILPFLAPFALAYACGGDTPPPNNPDNTTTSASAQSGSTASAADTTTTTASSGGATTASAAASTQPPPKETYTIPVADAKFTPDKTAKGWKATDLKADGTVTRMNKAYMKFVKNELQDDTGKAMFSVTKDGAVSMNDKPYAKFDDKDQMVITNGGTIIVGDDGAVKLLEPDGKPSKTVTGKFDNGKSKRAEALLIATELWIASASQPAPKK